MQRAGELAEEYCDGSCGAFHETKKTWKTSTGARLVPTKIQAIAESVLCKDIKDELVCDFVRAVLSLEVVMICNRWLGSIVAPQEVCPQCLACAWAIMLGVSRTTSASSRGL